MPGFAVSVEPTSTVPLIVGTGAVSTCSGTAAVAAEVFDTEAYPASDPVTVTVIDLPTADAGTVNVADVAPDTAVPATDH